MISKYLSVEAQQQIINSRISQLAVDGYQLELSKEFLEDQLASAPVKDAGTESQVADLQRQIESIAKSIAWHEYKLSNLGVTLSNLGVTDNRLDMRLHDSGDVDTEPEQ